MFPILVFTSYGRAQDAHGPRFWELAEQAYSGAPNVFANEHIERVK